MYKDAKRYMKDRGYASISEFVRNALRAKIYPELTENGFTPEFEEQVLKSAAQPLENDTVLETKEDIRNYFLYLKNPPKKDRLHDKDQKDE